MKTFKITFQIHEGTKLINQSIVLFVSYNMNDVLNILLQKLNQSNGNKIAFLKKKK